MANVCAIIANRGFFYSPHIIKEVEDGTITQAFKIKNEVKIDAKHFEPIITGMEQVTTMGNLVGYVKIPGIITCGKTGTVQNNQGLDHSVFTAFAPKENPQIALFVYVENGGWGSRYAAPMASLMIEKYLTGSISSNRKWIEKRMLDANLLNPNQSN